MSRLNKHGHEDHCSIMFPTAPCVCDCRAKDGLKVIIAGSREFNDYDTVSKAVKDSLFKVGQVVSGKARGVDTLGEEVAEELGVPVKPFPALWDDITVPGAVIRTRNGRKYNAAAGPQRNCRMGDYADALVAIRLKGSRGTTHMIDYMQSLGKPVYVVEVDE